MICIPVKTKNFKKLVEDFRISQGFGDLVEIWFDEIPEKDLTEQNLKKILQLKKKPIIYKYTAKCTSFGAAYFRRGAGKSRYRRENLILKHLKIDYIDMDIETPVNLIKTIKKLSPKSKIIISYHNFKSTPKDNELKRIAKKCLKKGADIIKIAAFAKTVKDSIRMLKFLEQTKRSFVLANKGFCVSKNTSTVKVKAICLCMGEKGRITRMAGHLFGNYLMYAPLELKKETAEGQIDVKKLRNFQNLIK